jgi:heme-degrading monooxygenase HmoA
MLGKANSGWFTSFNSRPTAGITVDRSNMRIEHEIGVSLISEEKPMSEFLDFLRHQFAYVAIGEFKPGKFEAAEQLFEKAVATYTTGFKGAYLLQLPTTDRGIAIIFWESVEEMAANQSESYQAILKEMAPLFVKLPDTDIYEIVSEIKPKHQ